MWWAERPEQGSLRAIIQAHSRKCILVRGIAWTGIHLRILNVRFQPGDEQLANARSMWQTSPGEIAVAEYLRIKSIQLDFDGRVVDFVYTDGIFKSDTGDSCIAYVNLNTVTFLRRAYIWGARGAQLSPSNTPMIRLRQKKQRQLTPPDLAEDPYILCILIALAQKQLEDRDQTDEPLRVSLLALPGARASHLYFYTACFPFSFLNKFTEPSLFLECPTVSISYVKIPLDKPEEFLYHLKGVLLETDVLGTEEES
ncbi:hypothetical protein MHUMG1_05162 [Metarhizium humberi]|uniref:Uncharacterized protein n=1 Tax=Metarhizium humberi TaxID=2596975 RepID=A0A9P8S802_9HYPO|nr:hypothetical protein MHUMG1_05162 [Metarhizium humberi]